MAATTSVELLRHGETVGGPRFRGSTDDALTGRGWEQMWHAVAPGPQPWTEVLCSPARRCADFAQALGERHGLPCTIDRRLREMHFGTWEGRSAAELMAADADALNRFWADPLRHTPPGAEPLADFAARVLEAWRDAARRRAGQRTLLVTHGGVMRVVLCHILGRPLHRLLDFEVAHAALLRVRVEQAPGQVRYALIGGAR